MSRDETGDCGVDELEAAEILDVEVGELPDDEDDLNPFRRLWRHRGEE